jgi:hypothetical protein
LAASAVLSFRACRRGPWPVKELSLIFAGKEFFSLSQKCLCFLVLSELFGLAQGSQLLQSGLRFIVLCRIDTISGAIDNR